MGFFDKKFDVYKEKGKRDEWKKARTALKDAGISISSSEVPSEAPVCGCGAKLDIRDFGPKGKIDRNWYYIMVAKEDIEKARTVLKDKGFPVALGE
jgi:hypothetical protein